MKDEPNNTHIPLDTKIRVVKSQTSQINCTEQDILLVINGLKSRKKFSIWKDPIKFKFDLDYILLHLQMCMIIFTVLPG